MFSPAETSSESSLPQAILGRAKRHGNEFAWRIDDIPAVIEAARSVNLLNVGGQLQFRLPDYTCECYWISVDTSRSVPSELPWERRVEQSALIAFADFENLKTNHDFLSEGRDGFAEILEKAIAQGCNLDEVMCFVWYVSAENVSPLSNGAGPQLK
jgi:hypothetical protein